MAKSTYNVLKSNLGHMLNIFTRILTDIILIFLFLSSKIEHLNVWRFSVEEWLKYKFIFVSSYKIKHTKGSFLAV